MGNILDILAADAAGHKAEANAALLALSDRKIDHAAAEAAFADLHKALSIKARFGTTSCSQCGNTFGPGEHGFSACSEHEAIAARAEALEHFERQHGQNLGPAPRLTVEQAAAKARLHSAAPELLAELLAAHRLLQIMLACLTPAGRFKFAAAAGREGLGTEGATRHHERADVIARATGVKS